MWSLTPHFPALTPVDVIVGGFPCQDVSSMGKRAGLHGERTGLFFDAMRIVESLKPKYIVLENVCGLINSNDGKDLETVIKTLAQLRYVGYWRVLDSRYFGVPQKRRLSASRAMDCRKANQSILAAE